MAESIGRAFKSIFLNMQKIQEGKDIKGINKLEDLLNKHGIALRKSEHEWRKSEDVIKDVMKEWDKMSPVTKSMVTQLIAGKNQAEQFNIIMNDSARVMQNYNGVLNATNSLDSKYQQHLESTEAKMNRLKATTEQLWMSFVNSSTINHLVGGLTNMVNALTQIAQAGWGTKLAIAGLGFTLLITTKHFGGFVKALITGKGMIGGVSTELSAFQIIMKLFTKAEIESTTATIAFKGALASLKSGLLAILTNPATWIFATMAVAIGACTIAIHKHIKKQQELKKRTDELKTSYKDLTTAMKNNDSAGIQAGADNLKKEQKKLQDLIKQQKELQKSLASHEVATSVKGGYSRNKSQELYETNKAIKEQIKVLQDAGLTIDETTGKINELSQAENTMKVNGFFEHVQGLAEEQVRYKKEIVGLWREYQTLSSVENKNEQQKYRLKQITDDLKRYMGDLTVETDKNGVATINNTELVGKQIDALDTENVSIDKLIDIKIQQAQQTQICEGNMTKCVYAEVGNRIRAYQNEIGALQAIRGLAFNKTYMMTGGDKIDSLAHQFGLKTGSEQIDSQIKARQDEINLLKDKEKEWNDRVTKLKNSLVAPSAPSHPNYSPQDVRGGSRGRRSAGGGSGLKSSRSSYSTDNTKYKFEGQALSFIDGLIKTINDSIEQTDKNIESITQKIANLQSLESKSNFKDILAQENEKLEAQKIKLERLKSAQSQADSMKNEIKNKIWSNWSNMKGKDLDSLSESDWTNLYNSMYGRQINFGTTDSAKKKEEAYKKGAELFKELKKNYEDASSLALDSADKQLKIEQEINSSIKERLETQSQMFNEEEERYQKRVSYSEYLKDVFNQTDADRLKYTKQILEVNKDYQDKLYDHVNILMAQRESLERNTTEWNILNQQIGEYQQKLIDTSKNVQDQKQAIKDLEWDVQIKNYTTLFNDLQDKIGDTHDKLEILTANNSNDYTNRVKLMDEELSHSIEYNAQLRIANQQLQFQLDKLEKGTDEWTKVHDKVEEYNENIDTSTKSILDQQKAIANLQWDTQVKRYSDILDAKKNDIEDLQAKLDILNTKDKNDIGTKLALMENILSANKNYLEQTEKLRDNLVAQRNELQEGTSEWEKVNNKVKEYDNNIRNTNKTVEQHNSEILKVKWDFKIKQYTELLNARKDAISDLQNELDIVNTQDEKNYLKKLAYMDKILQVNNDLLKKNTKLRDELVKQRDKLKVGTADWELINNKVKEYDNNINQTTKSIVQQNKAIEDLLKTRTRLLLDAQKKNQEKKLDKDIFGMSEDEWKEYHQRKIDRLKREIDEANEFVNKYGKNEYTDDELNAKNLELEQAKKETYENIKNYQEVFEAIHNQRIQAIDDELKRLDDKNNKEKISEEREKRRLELEKLRLELENTRNQKNIQQLTKDKNGLYQFVYVADQKKIDDLEQQIKDKEQDNVKWEQDLQDQEYRKKLEKEKKFEEDMMKAKQNFHSKENSKLQEHYQDMEKLVDEYLKNLKNKYDNNYADMLAMLETQIEEETKKETQFHEDSLKSKQQYYKEQIEKLDKYCDDKISKADQQYKNEEKKLKRHHDDEIDEINSHYKNMNSITEVHMDDLKSIYSSKWDEMLKILEDKVKKAEEMQKKLTEISNSSNSNGGNYSYKQAEKDFLDAKGKGNNKGANDVRDKYNKSSSSHHSSSSSSSLSNSSSSSKPKVSSHDESSFLKAKARGDNSTANSIRKKYSSFDTGGYTGSWGKDGKLAILHEKELVLNKYQTEDILKSVQLLQKYNPLNSIKAPNVILPNTSELGSNNKQPQKVVNEFRFDKIEFPSVTNDSGVENLANNFKRIAIQYNPD